MSQLADLSSLPDPAWVNIMLRLSLADRGRVSQTCHTLNEVFNHPSVWFKVNITLLASLSDCASTVNAYPLIIPEKFTIMIRRFGAYFQDLTLKISGHVARIDQACEDVLTLLAETCRLKSLTLQVGELVSRSAMTLPLGSAKLNVLATILRKAFRLQSLQLVSWPMHPRTTDFDVLQCLRDNEKIKELTDLSLFWCDPASKQWMSLNACLPSPKRTLDTVKHFASLRYLKLCSSMINDEVLSELCQPRRVRLSRLGLLVTYIGNDRKLAYPRISNHVWKKLRTSCPSLTVELIFTNTFVHDELVSFLSSDIPLASVSFMKYSRYQNDTLAYIAESYSKTLQAFHDFGDGCDVDADSGLVTLVSRCSSLEVLVYNGKIKNTTVLQLARLREQRWKAFQINIKNIEIVYPSPDGVAGSDDDVIRTDEYGSVCIVAHLPTQSEFYHTDQSEAQKLTILEALTTEVSQIIQQKWSPFHST